MPKTTDLSAALDSVYLLLSEAAPTRSLNPPSENKKTHGSRMAWVNPASPVGFLYGLDEFGEPC